MAPSDVFDIVVICTGNRFRSPLVAAYLREATKQLRVHVGSAGILDLGEVPAMDEAIFAADELGLDLRDHRSRYVGKIAVDEADLVLGFERMHVTTAVVDGSAAPERVFTLPELVALLEQSPPMHVGDPVERARARIAHVSGLRGPTATLRFPEIADPIGTPAQAQREIAFQVIDLSARLVSELFGVPASIHAPPRGMRIRGRG